MIQQEFEIDNSESQTSADNPIEPLDQEMGPGFEVTLIEGLAELLRRRRLIAMATGGALLLGLLYSLSLPNLYTSTTKIMTPQQTQSSAAMMMAQLANSSAGSLAAAAGTTLGLKNPNDLYVGLLSSRPIADALVDQFKLVQVYKVRDRTAARKVLTANTQMISEKSGFLALSVTDTDKDRAAQIANAYTEQLRALTKTMAVTEASQRRLFYEEQLKQAKESLATAELALQQVQQQKGLIQLDAQSHALIEGLATLRAQVAAKQVEVEALRSYSTEKNPAVQLAERQLHSLQSQQAGLEQSRNAPGIEGLGLASVPSAGLEYLRAFHEVQYRQALYDMLMKQYDAARLDEAKDAAIIQVVEPAVAPTLKSSPKRLLILVSFALGGFLSACVWVRVLWWRTTLKSTPAVARAIENLKAARRARLTAQV